jgi:predicted transcriptional regulator
MANTSGRNHEMLAAYEAGRTVEQLSEDHGLACTSVRSILTGERHKRRLSPELFYRALRGDLLPH